MSSASYPIVTGSKKGIQLDPRTKLILVVLYIVGLRA